MRLWSIHPKYLDAKGLVALWREGLLAQKVLKGETKGYTNHPQLTRFKSTSDPVAAIATYLHAVADEADRRGYRFDRSKLAERSFKEKLTVTTGQVDYERTHLEKKLKQRDSDCYAVMHAAQTLELHPLFEAIEGEVEAWEKV